MSDASIKRLGSTDGFVLTDFPAAERADGIVRCARKVLVDSTRALARSRSYAWALVGEPISGASCAVNAEGDARAPALEAFCAEVAPMVKDGGLTIAAGKGVEEEELSTLPSSVTPDHTALATGIVAAARTARDLGGARVAIEFDGGAPTELTAALEAAGAEVVASGPDAIGAESDVLLVGSKPALLDHNRISGVSAELIVPTGHLPVTPRALAVAGRAGKTVLADFLTTAGPLAARAGKDVESTISETTARCLAHEEGPVPGACVIAEDFLGGWVGVLPFGRPI